MKDVEIKTLRQIVDGQKQIAADNEIQRAR